MLARMEERPARARARYHVPYRILIAVVRASCLARGLTTRTLGSIAAIRNVR